MSPKRNLIVSELPKAEATPVRIIFADASVNFKGALIGVGPIQAKITLAR